MQTPPRVLAVGAHPDDVEFMCAGTLALLKEAGWEVHVSSVGGGDCGSMTLSGDEIREIRLKECADAAEVLDAQYYWAGGDDVEIEYSHDLRLKVLAVLRKVRADLVITHPPADYIIDHEETSKLVRSACFNASIPNCITDSLGPTDKVPHLYYADAMDSKDILGRPLPIQFFVDIASVMQTKEEMLGRHRSQRDWLRKQHGMDQYIEHMKHQAAMRGEKAGVQYAEAFCQHLGHAYPQSNLLADVLGENIHIAK